MDLQNVKREQHRFTLQNKFILNNRFFWEFLRFIVLNYYIFEAVLSSTFYSMYIITQTTLLPMNIIFLIFLLVDFIYKIFVTPYPVFHKITDYKKIRKMLKYYFIQKKMLIDLLVLLIFSVSFIVPFHAARILRLFIVFRFLEITEFNKQIYKRIHTYNLMRKMYTIAKIFYLLFLFSHYFGCWFQLMDQNLIDNEYYGPVNTGNQLYYQLNSGCFSPIQALDDSGRYLYGFYFASSLISTIAYGDIVPKNPFQEVYVTVLLVFSTVSIALILQQFMLMVRNDSLGLYEFITKYNCLKTRMDDNGIRRDMQNKVRSFLVYIEYERKFHAHEPIVQRLPRKLKNDLAQQGYSHYIGPIFTQIGIKGIYSLCDICDESTFQAQTQIFDPQDSGHMFQFLYLRSGSVQQYVQLSKSKKYIPTHRKFFNFAKLILNCRVDPDEDEAISTFEINNRKLRCIKLSQFISIKRVNFEKYMNKRKELLKKVRKIRQKIMLNEMSFTKLGQDCSICMYPNNIDHTCEQCPYSHFVVSERINKAHKLLQLNAFKKHERKATFNRNRAASKKINNTIHYGGIFMRLEQGKQSEKKGEKATGLLKRMFQMMEQEREQKSLVDSAYDHSSTETQFSVYYQQPERQHFNKY